MVNSFVVEPSGNSEYSFSLYESILFRTLSFLSSYSTNFFFFHKFSFYYHLYLYYYYLLLYTNILLYI